MLREHTLIFQLFLLGLLSLSFSGAKEILPLIDYLVEERGEAVSVKGGIQTDRFDCRISYIQIDPLGRTSWSSIGLRH